MLQGIEEQIRQVKKITSGENEIEIDDELNYGQKKTIIINANIIKNDQIDQIKIKIKEDPIKFNI